MSTAMTQSDASSSQNQLAFLRMAAEDDRFRAELQTNPTETLTRFGLRIPEAALTGQIKLPAKAEIGGALANCAWVDLENTTDAFDQQYWSGLRG